MKSIYLLTQQEARELLIPYANEFYQAIQWGFNDYISAQKHKPVKETSTKSHMVWDYILQRVNAVVMKHQKHLQLRKTKRMFFVVIDSKMAIKFKKFDEKLKSGNVKTNQVHNFRNHAFKFDGQEIFPIEIGWNVDEFYSNITTVNFISPNGESFLWRMEYRPAEKNYSELFAPKEIDVIQEVTLREDLQHDKRAS